MRAEAADRAFLDRHDQLMIGGEAQDQIAVERLGEARVGDGRRKPARRQFLGRLERFGEPRPKRQDGDPRAAAQHAPLADRQGNAALGDLDADAVAARVAQRDRAGIMGGASRDHVDELGFVSRRHHRHVGQAGEIGDVERAGVGRSVGADQPGAVDGEAHRQVLHRNIVHDLVVGALKEGRIDRAERLETLGGEAGGEGDGVLLGDADVEHAVGISFAEAVDAGALRHRRGDGDDLVVARALGDQRVGEHACVARRIALRLGLGAGDDVEGGDAVVLVVGGFGGRIAFALLGDDMHQHRPARHVAHVLEHRQQVVEIVAVDRPDVVEAELLEQGAAGEKAAAVFLGLPGLVVEEARQPLGQLLGDVAQRHVSAAGDEPRQIGRHRAGRRRDRHVVVVENDDQPRLDARRRCSSPRRPCRPTSRRRR